MKGIHFVSENGNKYFYNDETGFIELHNKDTNYEEDAAKDITEEKEEEIRWAKPEEIKDYLFSGSGFKQLILEVTQNCNLACKYCCFSEHYKNTRAPSKVIMSYETGKKAIDYYMSVFKQKKYMNPGKNPSVGFYGGEPLLNLNLIKDLVSYMHTTYSEYEFEHNITTNGVLLTDDVIDFLVKYDFSVVISIDGDKKNHDRNRVKVNGGGSFDEAMGAYNRFRKKYPDYFKLGTSTCYDYLSDLEALKKFIEENDLFVISANMISSLETDYYSQFTEEDKKKFSEQYLKLEKEFLDKAKNDKGIVKEGNNIYNSLFLVGYMELCAHSLMSQKRNEFIPYGGCCVPGEKMFVSATGKLHTCERISDKFPIGDVDSGFNFDNITKLVNAFNANQKKCRKCNVSRLCGLCYSKLTCGDKLVFSDELCKSTLNDNINRLTNFVNIMEKNPKGFDKLTSNYFRDMTDKTNGTLF